MSRSKNVNAKGRRINGKFIAIPAVVYNHPDYIRLRNSSKALLVDILTQYNGHNNGDLCAAEKLMKERGWKSNSQRNKALKELSENGILLLTQHGGKKIPTLYAVTWRPIDKCNGKISIGPTDRPWRDFTKN